MSDKVQNKRTPLLKILLVVGGSLLALSLLAWCGSPTAPDALAPVDYEPLPGPGWPVSMPEEQGLDPFLVDGLFREAGALETIYGLLVIKNGQLVTDFIDALPGQ